MNFVILEIIVVFWFLFISFGILAFVSLKVKKVSFGEKLALVLAGSIFIGLIIYVSKDRFYKTNFCLMNKNDPICIKENNNCFDEMVYSNYLISGFNFGIGKLIKINSSIESENKGDGKITYI